MPGTARVDMVCSRGREKSSHLPEGIRLSRSKSTRKEATAARAWQIRVARASPPTPMSVLTTKTMSRPMLEREDTIRKIRGVRVSPRAVKMPVQVL